MSAGNKIANLLRRRLEAIQPAKAFTESVESQETLLLDLATDELDKGRDMNGGDLGEYANIAYKGRLRPVDLKDTGDFRRSFELDVKGGRIEVDATDVKTVKLTDRYGDDIVGLPVQRWEEVKDIVSTGMIDVFRKELRK